MQTHNAIFVLFLGKTNEHLVQNTIILSNKFGNVNLYRENYKQIYTFTTNNYGHFCCY